MDIFSKINAGGGTILLVTHNAKIAARAERIMFMSDGKIVSELQFPRYIETDIKKRIQWINSRLFGR